MVKELYISKSKVRQNLLILFFANPSEKYYVRQLERLLGYSAGNIRRELLKLQKDDLFLTKREGNLLYYYLNKAHPLFKELKSIFNKTIGIDTALSKALRPVKKIESAFIYGSFAKDKQKSTSDIDLMIIGSPDTSLLNEKIAEVENRFQREINITLYSAEEYKSRKKNKSGFILDLLDNPKTMLIGDEDDL